MRYSCTCASALFLLTLAFANLGRADPAKKAIPADARGYTYQFTDDPLAAGGFDAHDARIVVASHAVRTTLIRPRTTFVAEMLKTVENL